MNEWWCGSGSCGSQGMNGMNESKLVDLLNGSEYVPTYEDKDDDWMLVGDVPWEWALLLLPALYLYITAYSENMRRDFIISFITDRGIFISGCSSNHASAFGSWKDQKPLASVSWHLWLLLISTENKVQMKFPRVVSCSFHLVSISEFSAPRAMEKCKNRSWGEDGSLHLNTMDRCKKNQSP